MSRRRRSPTEEELRLWQRVAGSATPMAGRARPRPTEDRAQPLRNDQPTPAAIDPIEPFDIGSRRTTGRSSVSLSPSVTEHLSRQPVQMDQKVFGKLTRGKLEPEARIDLHGMTLDRAHSALTAFILRSADSGHRLVLVITGKGKTREDGGVIPERRGVLRHHVPNWLQAGLLRSVVMQVTPAHRRHGGSGAYYVYLRRNR